MIHYHFDKKLVSTNELIGQLSIPISQLDYWKDEIRTNSYKVYTRTGGTLERKDWLKENDPCWDMGLRLIGNKALWDPVMFLNWIYKYKLKNKPKDFMEREDNKKLIAFIKRNASVESV